MRVGKSEPGQQRGEPVLRGGHQPAMERGADRQCYDPLGAGFFGELAGSLHRFGRAGDDGLRGRVQVGGGDDLAGLVDGLRADGCNGARGQPEDRGHRTLAGWHGLLHEASTRMHGAHGVGEQQHTGADQRGVLAQRVTGDDGGGDTVPAQDCFRRDRNSHDRGLGEFGQAELLFRTLEAQLADREA